MLLINKKRLIFISSIIVISIFFSAFLENSNYLVEPVSSTPLANHVIILDAGHGKPDGGAVSSDGNIIESEINLNIVLKLQNLLEAANCKVLLTRSDENGIYETTAKTIREKKVSDMKNRVQIANTSKADLFISIHMNKLPQEQYYGWQTFYKNNDNSSKLAAQNVQSSLNKYIKTENTRQIKSISGIYLTKNVEIPIIIVECGFLSNKDEAKLLTTDNYQNQLAWGIYIGIMDYFQTILTK